MSTRSSDTLRVSTCNKLEALTENQVFCRITNLVIDGLDGRSNQPEYKTQYRVTLGQRGNELCLAIGDTLSDAMDSAYDWAVKQGLIRL